MRLKSKPITGSTCHPTSTKDGKKCCHLPAKDLKKINRRFIQNNRSNEKFSSVRLKYKNYYTLYWKRFDKI